MERWKISSAPIPLRDICMLFTWIQEAKQNVGSGVGQRLHYTPIKKKYLRANQGEFMPKELNKAIMIRSRLPIPEREKC